MKRLELWQIIFSLKAYIAAMLALYIAYSIDLPRPYWALTTAYVVSQPFAASSLSKGLFRISGTFIGAGVAIALGAVFGADEMLMLIGLGSWFAVCGYFALLDRTPRSYFFLLSGLTALVVGWPGAAPQLFDTALARFEEIGLGILCTVLVHSLILPRPVGPAIRASLDAWGADARRLVLDTLRGSAGRSGPDRTRLAGDAAPIGILAVQLSYDGPDRRGAGRWLEILRQRMLMLLPITASLEERIAALRGISQAEGLDAVLGFVASWVERGCPRAELALMRRTLAALEPPATDTSWPALQLGSVLERLRELIDIARDCQQLRAHLAAPQPASRRLRAAARRVSAEPHRDPAMAILSIVGAFAAAGVAAALWYFTGQAEFSGATQIALMMCLFLGAADDLRPVLRSMLGVLCLALVIDSFYLFIVMPRIEDFWVLALALAPALLPLGLLGANPATIMTGLMPIAMLTVSETASTAIAPFADGLLATEAGVAIALLLTGVVRSIGVETSARRLLRAGWRDLQAIAVAPRPADRRAFTSRMLDRIGLLAPRLAALPESSDIRAADAMADLRLGLDLAELQRLRPRLAGAPAALIGDLLDRLSGYFSLLRRRGPVEPGPGVLELLDRTIAAVAGAPALRNRRALLLALTGIRSSLFAHADAPAAEMPEPEMLAEPRLAAE